MYLWRTLDPAHLASFLSWLAKRPAAASTVLAAKLPVKDNKDSALISPHDASAGLQTLKLKNNG